MILSFYFALILFWRQKLGIKKNQLAFFRFLFKVYDYYFHKRTPKTSFFADDHNRELKVNFSPSSDFSRYLSYFL